MYLTFLITCYIGFPQFQEICRALTSEVGYNVTLPMILSEWQKLYYNSRYKVWISRLPTELGAAYWMNWMPNTTHDISGTLLERFASYEKTQLLNIPLLYITESWYRYRM